MERLREDGVVIAAGTVRGTQSFVHTLSAVLEAAFADGAGGAVALGCMGFRRCC